MCACNQRGRINEWVQLGKNVVFLHTGLCHTHTRESFVSNIRGRWRGLEKELRVTCITVLPKGGRMQCNWKCQWVQAQICGRWIRSTPESGADYRDAEEWIDQRSAEVHTEARTQEGFDAVYRETTGFVHELEWQESKNLATPALILEWEVRCCLQAACCMLRSISGPWLDARHCGGSVALSAMPACARGSVCVLLSTRLLLLGLVPLSWGGAPPRPYLTAWMQRQRCRKQLASRSRSGASATRTGT